MCFTPALVTASSMAAASLTVMASGFSQMTSFPASAAAIEGARCWSSGVHTSRIWMSGSSSISFQSV